MEQGEQSIECSNTRLSCSRSKRLQGQKIFSTLFRPKGANYLTLHFHHAKIPFCLIVCKWNEWIIGKTADFILVFLQAVNKRTDFPFLSTDSNTIYFVYGIGLISQEDDCEVLFYHFNNIGSTEAVTNLDGKIQEKFEYGPYGELLSENKCGIIFLYNGEYGVSTDENGLYYMRARYYNPEIKRFINQDVVIGSIADSPSLNRYAYVEGNPISLVDPFGLSPGVDWRGAGHTILGFLGLLTFVPGLNWVGIAANAINAAWYFAEGDIFNGICSSLAALPGLGGVVGKIGSASRFSNTALMIQKGTQIASNIGFMATGAYTIGKMGYDNYQKYVVRGEDFSVSDLIGDAVNGTFAVLSIYGGAKGLGFDKIKIGEISNSISFGENRPYELYKTREARLDIIKRGCSEEYPIFATDTPTNKFASYVKNIPPIDDFYDVALHGSPTYAEFFGEPIDAYTLSNIIRNRSDYQIGTNIRLLSCSTGNTTYTGNCFAQILANELGVKVKAPTDIIYVRPNGSYYIGDDAQGIFKMFYPRK